MMCRSRAGRGEDTAHLGLAARGQRPELALLALEQPRHGSILPVRVQPTGALEPALVSRGFASERHPTQRSGILSVRPPPEVDLGGLWRGLGEHGVACSIPDGRLRFAPHWPNALDEVPRVIEALDRCLRAP